MTDRKKPTATRKSKRGLWGARFDGGPSAAMRAIGDSLHVDRRLADQDLRASIAHARMLGEQGILRRAEARKIVSGRTEIWRRNGFWQAKGGAHSGPGDRRPAESFPFIRLRRCEQPAGAESRPQIRSIRS